MRLPSWSRYLLSLSLLGSGVLLSATINSGHDVATMSASPYSAIEDAQFDVDYTGGHLSAYGHGASVEHENAIAAIARDDFGSDDLSLRPIIIAPDGWQLLTENVLHAVAATESASVSVSPGQIRINGVVRKSQLFQIRLQELDKVLPPGALLIADVIEVTTPSRDYCAAAASDLKDERISYETSSAVLRSSAFATLDRYVELANDCRDHKVVVTGHTDSRGDETWNEGLSLARAEAVTTYLGNRGVGLERLVAAGAGSSYPIADNDTAWGRIRNRRIELDLRVSIQN